MKSLKVDVCIIGAGFAGLAAAYKLKQSGKTLVVLEARDRVGGRVYTHSLSNNIAINRGGTWLGQGHQRMHALVKELGMATYRQYVQGDNLMILNGKTHRYAGTLPSINLLALADVGLAMNKLNRMAKQVPLDSPWNSKKAKEWDSQTIGGWISSRWHVTTDTGQKIIRSIFSDLFMSDPAEVSLLHGLHLIHSLKSLEWILSAIGGAQQDLIVGGMQGIADQLAAKLGADTIHLKAPVQHIQQDNESIKVRATNLTVQAERVIIAIPPILASRINYEPALPLIKSQLLERSAPGQGIKWHAVYKEAFWRKEGLTGQGADMDDVPNVTIDCSPVSGETGVIAGFAFGPSARKLASYSAEERLEVWIKGLKKRFGPRAAEPIAVDEYDWSADPWARGDMFAHYAPGVLTGFGRALREPCGRIHWAGTETAIKWSGSIEGATLSGERAAEEVLKLC
ncbi:flavin monoamine oxidase family protein [Legionella sp. D16C41]|uniref:flavin monoamine oxidase family protein n=1 Tax=Legionella sp. D16C41 TaxID=3402688 RepID=UPI003AF82060